MNKVIMTEDAIIGTREDIEAEINYALKKGWVDDYDMTESLFKELASAPEGILECVYHPMGAWHIERLDTH